MLVCCILALWCYRFLQVVSQVSFLLSQESSPNDSDLAFRSPIIMKPWGDVIYSIQSIGGSVAGATYMLIRWRSLLLYVRSCRWIAWRFENSGVWSIWWLLFSFEKWRLPILTDHVLWIWYQCGGRHSHAESLEFLWFWFWEHLKLKCLGVQFANSDP